MDNLQRYEFDRQGYLVIRSLLSPSDVGRLQLVVERLEDSAAAWPADDRPHRSAWGMRYRHDSELGILIAGARQPGGTIIIEDFWNADPAFDTLIDHPMTLAMVGAVMRERVTINNSEIRIRYPGNHTAAHMGGPLSQKYRYRSGSAGIDCGMVRMVYFLQRVQSDDGAFSVIPGSHKSVFSPPVAQRPEDEPGAIPLEVEPGDAIFFTEHLRHGGFTNRGAQVRRTVHVGYGPAWMRSQNIATMDQPQYITQATWDRLTPERRELFLPNSGDSLDNRLPPCSRAAILAAG